MEETLSFDCIALSEKEERLLMQIKNENIPDVISSESLERLFRHNLVQNSMRVSVSGSDSSVYMKAVLITDYGKDYLAYVRKLRYDRKRNFWQSVFITILSSILGALLSQPVWDFLNKLFTASAIS
jgi:hypothetical protein